ncbi:hypothetical protein MHYP_G00061840 [Metynnis hypsauchen]
MSGPVGGFLGQEVPSGRQHNAFTLVKTPVLEEPNMQCQHWWMDAQGPWAVYKSGTLTAMEKMLAELVSGCPPGMEKNSAPRAEYTNELLCREQGLKRGLRQHMWWATYLHAVLLQCMKS